MSILDTIMGLFGGNKSDTAAEIVAKSEPAPVAAAQVESSVTTKIQVPEDSTLRRHFISKLKAEIESGMPPRPTDSSLIRHYDASVQAELDKILG